MTYTTGGLIQAADYNKFVQGGATVDHNVANVNTIWGVGFGDRGYGQTGELATVPATNVVTATQWATLIARLNSIRTHQIGTNTGVTAPVAGSTISYINTLQTFVDAVYSNRMTTSIQGTDSPIRTTTHVWNVASPTTFQIVRTFTFADADQARYFFNGGGQLSLAFNTTDSLSNLKGANWVSFLNSKLASFTLAGKSSGRTGIGGSVTLQAPATGYWGLTTTDQTLLAITSGTATGVYDSNTISVKARTNGVQGANGDNGTVITVTIDLNDIALDSDLADNVNLSIAVNGTARRPETTALPTAIAYPSLVPITYAITPSTTAVSEGGTVTFTVTTTGIDDGTVLYWSQTSGSTTVTGDFTNNLIDGTVTITGGTATFTRTLVNDIITDGSETFAYQLRTGSAAGPVVATSATVTVADTSTGPFIFSPTISANTTSYNLRSAAIAAGWNQVSPLTANVSIANGVIVGASSTSAYAFDTGTGFPAGTTLRLNIGTGAYVIGAGGAGGSAIAPVSGSSTTGGGGGAGGPALRAQAAITIANSGTIGGGGGGGGSGSQGSTQSTSYSGSSSAVTAAGGGGAGGAGFIFGVGGTRGTNLVQANGSGTKLNETIPTAGGQSTITASGSTGTGGRLQASSSYTTSAYSYGGNGGAGGTLGNAGSNGAIGAGSISFGGAGGAAGAAVTGATNITWSPKGTVLGPTDEFVFNTTISADTNNYNLRSAAIAAGWNQVLALNATVTIASNVVVGATSTGAYAFDTGSGFPAGTTLRLNNNGFIYGAGGAGGTGGFMGSANNTYIPGGAGGAGGPALRAQAAITVANNGTIGSGGGGGGGGIGGVSNNQDGINGTGGGGGGGGIGYVPGLGGTRGGTNYGNVYTGADGAAGTTSAGGTGGIGAAANAAGGSGVYSGTPSVAAGTGANGAGAYGTAGGTAANGNPYGFAAGGAGGAAGTAVTGTTNITWSPMGTILGPTDAFIFSPVISTTTTNYNLRSAAIAAGWNQVAPLVANVTINGGVVVGATSTGAYAFDTGTGFPAGTSLSLSIGTGAYIVGAGGGGGGGGIAPSGGAAGTANGSAGGGGGPALRAQAAIAITNSGTIGGGGGGGGGGASGRSQAGSNNWQGGAGGNGGGGAGYVPGNGASLTGGGAGSAGTPPSDGNNLTDAQGGSGGGGGSLGTGGASGTTVSAGSPGGGGAAGAAVTGNANITWNATGTRLGAIA